MNSGLGIVYALVAALLWGVGPPLLKKGMTLTSVSAATLIQQGAAVIALAVVAAFHGETGLRPGTG